MEEDLKTKVLLRLQAQCSRREYCRKDVMDKALKALEGDRDAAAAVVEDLVRERYVDDLRYASAFARERAALSGWGAVKIRYMLAAKGIPRETVDRAMEEIDGAAARRKMESVIRARYRTLEGEPDAKLKLLRFALGRGYDYADVKSVVDGVVQETD